MAIQIKFTNNFVATLAAAISDADTAITLDAGSGAKLPNYGGGDYEYMTLGNTANNLEIVKVTARVGDILTVVRGVDGTTAKAWSAGDQINSRPCAAAMNDALQVNVAKADVDSQVFTGTPVLPTGTIAVTQAAGNSTTKIATTAFVTSAIATAETAMEAYADAAVEAAGIVGANQTWQDVSGSRAKNTAYQNTTDSTISVAVRGGPSSTMFLEVSEDGVTYVGLQNSVDANNWGGPSERLVPVGHYYRARFTAGNIADWNELRE